MNLRKKLEKIKLDLEADGMLSPSSTGYIRCNLDDEVKKQGISYRKGVDYDVAKPYEPDKDMGDVLTSDSGIGYYVRKLQIEKPEFKGLVGMVHGVPATKEGEDKLREVMQIYADHYNLPIIAKIGDKDISLLPASELEKARKKGHSVGE